MTQAGDAPRDVRDGYADDPTRQIAPDKCPYGTVARCQPDHQEVAGPALFHAT